MRTNAGGHIRSFATMSTTDAAEYLRGNVEPDRLAIVALERRSGAVTQTIAEGENDCRA